LRCIVHPVAPLVVGTGPRRIGGALRLRRHILSKVISRMVMMRFPVPVRRRLRLVMAGGAMMVTMAMPLTVVVMVVLMGVMVFIMVIVMMVATVCRASLFVGPSLRLERAFDLAEPGAEATQHVGDPSVTPNSEPFRAELGLPMPIAEMPGKAGQMAGIVPSHFGEILGLGDDLDKASIIEDIGVAMGESGSFSEIDKKIEAAHGREGAMAAVALVEGEDHRIGEVSAANGVSRHEAMGMEHGFNPARNSRRVAAQE
jgi:hypothetical protein